MEIIIVSLEDQFGFEEGYPQKYILVELEETFALVIGPAQRMEYVWGEKVHKDIYHDKIIAKA